MRFIARRQVILYAVLFRFERKVDGAVQVPEDDLVHLILLKELRKERVLELDVKRRIVNERENRISLRSDLFDLLKTELKALAFAKI